MRKRNSIFTAVFAVAAWTIFFLLCPAGRAQTPSQISFAAGVPFQLGLSWTFTSSSTQTAAFNTGGLQYYELVFVPTGTVSGCTLTVDGSPDGTTFTTGSLVASQTCTSAGSFNSSSATYSKFGKVTPTITGTGSVTVYLFGFVSNTASGGSSVTVTNFPGTQPVSGTVSTQPSGFASIVAFEQAVTGSAVVLATNAVHGFCVKALPINSITVYVGPTGVTTATGYPLAAGDSICYQASNTNLAFVIASTTGASVAVSGN